MSIFSPKKGKTLLLYRKGEKLLISVGDFLRKFYFLTDVI